jgi:hypothetical protein
MQESYQSLVRFPVLIDDQGSLSAMEKSLLGHFLLLVNPRVIVELGVFHAVTTEFICEFVNENKMVAKVIGFDLPNVIAELRDRNAVIKDWETLSRLELIPGRMPKSLENWLHNSECAIDLALLDATHDYRSVMGELSLLWPRLSSQGYILCHDYSNKYDGVRYAVDVFAAKRGAMVLPLHSSEHARQAGHGSVLVAMCRRPYRPTLRRLLHHRWLSAKSDLLLYPVINKIWSRVRPLVR